MKIGDRLLKAVIQSREQARNTYEQAKNEGKSATLLEQQRPNVFQMNVANIMPGDTIIVAMKYTELLVPESGVYEFVYPAVTGPRYSNKAEATASADDKWVSNPYTHSGEKPLYDFGIRIRILAGLPLQDISCPSHQMDIHYSGESEAMVSLGKDKAGEGNRDVILQYRLAGGKIQTGLMLSEGDNDVENFFLAMVQPPEKPSQSIIPAREYIFIVDVSGSMYGFPLDVSKKLLKNLISGLRPTDKFNVLLFAGSASLLSETSVTATEENLARAIKLIDQQRGGGGTELIPALKKAMAVEKVRGVSRTFVIATDGYVDVEKESFAIIRENLDKANFFAFGIGSSVNRFLIEGIAHAGMGEAFIVTNGAEAEKQAEKFRKYISTPVLTDVKISYEGFDVYDVEPLLVPGFAGRKTTDHLR
jgi:Ca-activated chloride channel homolog